MDDEEKRRYRFEDTLTSVKADIDAVMGRLFRCGMQGYISHENATNMVYNLRHAADMLEKRGRGFHPRD